MPSTTCSSEQGWAEPDAPARKFLAGASGSASLPSTLELDELGEDLRDFSLLGVAWVQQDAIAELEVLPLAQTGQLVVPLHGGESGFRPAERVGGHQPVPAAMPVRPMGVRRV